MSGAFLFFGDGGVCCLLGSSDQNLSCLSVCLSVPPLPFEFCHVSSFPPLKVHLRGRISAEAILAGIISSAVRDPNSSLLIHWLELTDTLIPVHWFRLTDSDSLIAAYQDSDSLLLNH